MKQQHPLDTAFSLFDVSSRGQQAEELAYYESQAFREATKADIALAQLQILYTQKDAEDPLILTLPINAKKHKRKKMTSATLAMLEQISNSAYSSICHLVLNTITTEINQVLTELNVTNFIGMQILIHKSSCPTRVDIKALSRALPELTKPVKTACFRHHIPFNNHSIHFGLSFRIGDERPLHLLNDDCIKLAKIHGEAPTKTELDSYTLITETPPAIPRDIQLLNSGLPSRAEAKMRSRLGCVTGHEPRHLPAHPLPPPPRRSALKRSASTSENRKRAHVVHFEPSQNQEPWIFSSQSSNESTATKLIDDDKTAAPDPLSRSFSSIS